MPSDPGKADLHILVVDDQPGVRLTLQGVLSKKGYQVAVAADGATALEMTRKTPFRVIFMDIKMPGMSGVETFIKIKEINPAATVIMMTGFAVEDDVKRAIQEGAYAVIYKPFDMDKILSIVETCMDGHRFILVVDDEPSYRRLMKEILEHKGFQVLTVESGEECLRVIKERPFQIIILDVQLPGMTGLETLNEVKKIQPDVGVVVVTAHSVEEVVQHSLINGSFAFLRKPIDIEKLIETLDQCLKRDPENLV